MEIPKSRQWLDGSTHWQLVSFYGLLCSVLFGSDSRFLLVGSRAEMFLVALVVR